MALFDASSKTSTSDSRQTAGDSSQLVRGTGAKLIQGGTDLSRAKVNTGTQIKGSKITGNDLSKAKFGNGATVNIGANPDDLTALAQSTIAAFTNASANNATLLGALTHPTATGAPTPSGSDLSSIVSGALAAAGIGQSPTSASSGDDNSAAPSTSGGLAAWWSGLSTTMKWVLAGGAALLLGALLFMGKKS
jgi:hypothetical protein